VRLVAKRSLLTSTTSMRRKYWRENDLILITERDEPTFSVPIASGTSRRQLLGGGLWGCFAKSLG
jgi:hypothetical protein